MKKEVSAGIILFNEYEKRKFLLLNYPSRHWDFVKGKMEDGEDTKTTALRETKEETGITDVDFCNGFEEEIEYYFRIEGEQIHKKVIFFLGKTETTDVKLSHEHLNFVWLDFEHALDKITYDNAKNLLKKSLDFLDN
tara:strand:- start:1655 stop:2065 length:411 start_codon:yes stop_codon:yes gene_type:complete